MTNNKNITAQPAQDFIRIQDLFYLCLEKWHWFAISLTACLGLGLLYLLITPAIYTRNTAILIKDESNGKSATAEMESFADLGLFTSNANVNNEIVTLKSRDLMREVVARLNLNTDYRAGGILKKSTLYAESLPIRAHIIGLPDNCFASFVLNLNPSDLSIQLSDFVLEKDNLESPSIIGRLSDTITSPIGKIVITPTAHFAENEETEIHISHYSLIKTADDYLLRLTASLADEKANVINLAIQDVSTRRADDILATLIAVYNENWVQDKNQIAISTSMFINDRLGVIENELGNVDNDISTFKSEHLLPDVNAAANMYMARADEANAIVTDLNIQIYMARYIKNYLANEINRHQLLPANSGLGNQSITHQINEYNELLLERNSLVAQSSIKNPLVVETDTLLSAMREALNVSIENHIVALNEQIKSQQAVGRQATSQIASNPQQSKYLLNVERQQKVKETLYLYLLQKREENELSQAFTAYNTRIITKPGGADLPSSPIKRNIILVAIVLGLIIPTVIIFITETTNTKVRSRNDLNALAIPYLGEIPLLSGKRGKQGKQPHPLVVKVKSRDIINEAFRVVRTNIEFMLDNKKDTNVIMLTSANPGSGKSFISLNLASSLAIKNKKVVLIDLDLRKASLSSYINKPQTGISNYLAGKADSISDITYQSPDISNLTIIPVGIIPPNPTELLFEEKLSSLIETLRHEYDYVFIDCPPVEIIADAAIISKLANITLFIIRAGLLERRMLPEIQKFYTEKKYKNLCVILNGTNEKNRIYGYGYGYIQ